jgi:ferritin
MNYLIPNKSFNIIYPLATAELEQTSFYKRLAVVCNKLGYLLAEKFFIKESEEENDHFLIWQRYINGRGNNFDIPSIESQSVEAENLYDAVELALSKEIEVLKMYEQSYAEVMSVDVASSTVILKFIDIQIEAVTYYTDVCAVLRDLDKNGQISAEHSLFEEN